VALKHECINFLLKIAFCHFFFKLLNYQKYINIKYQKNFWVTLNKFKKRNKTNFCWYFFNCQINIVSNYSNQ
jgi:hypothetical protein